MTVPDHHTLTKRATVSQLNDLLDDSRLPASFWSKIEVLPDGCWQWIAATNADGYGIYWYKNASRYSHIVSYSVLVQPIAPGFELDHLCRLRPCAHPLHLEQVTHKENVRRGKLHEVQGGKMRCPQKHLYDAANTYVNSGRRFCRQCRADRDLAVRKARK